MQNRTIGRETAQPLICQGKIVHGKFKVAHYPKAACLRNERAFLRGGFGGHERAQVGDHFRAGPILRADNFAVELAVRGNDVRFGIDRRAVRSGDLLRRIEVGGE